MIVGTKPIFTVTDVQRAVEHYQRLGFSTSFHDETYAFAHCDNLTIHLAHRDDPASEGTAALYLHVDDAEELAAEWRRAGMQVAGPEDFDYGKREGWHVDPDGNKIRFGSPLPQPGQLFHVMTPHNGVVRRWKSCLDRDEAYAAAGTDTPSGAPAR